MGEFISWPKVSSWEDFGYTFLLISVISFFVSLFANRQIKNSPALAVQVSILFTLLIYPIINLYLIMGLLADKQKDLFAITGEASYGPFIFFIPLPVCVIVGIISHLSREHKRRNTDSRIRTNGKSKGRLRIAEWVLSVLTGAVWLCFAMVFERGRLQITAFKFLAYTIFGFVVYLVVAFIVHMVRLLLVKWGQQGC